MTTNNWKAYVVARVKDGNKVLAFFNISDEQIDFYAENELLGGTYTDIMDGTEHTIASRQQFFMKPWEFKIFVAK
jgi:hypothetical protein